MPDNNNRSPAYALALAFLGCAVLFVLALSAPVRIQYEGAGTTLFDNVGEDLLGFTVIMSAAGMAFSFMGLMAVAYDYVT